MSFAPGENVGVYRIVEKLGQGGMATVYKAHHPALDRFVALKVLHPAFQEDPGFVERFRREARIVARLDHPNIVPIYDFAEHAGQPYLVLRFVEGETLKARMRQGQLPTDEVLRIVRTVGAALTYAHDQGILHRDVKPSNVLLTPSGQLLLTDFGLARLAAAGESTLSRDAMIGTPQYISPEQARGDVDIDARSDIYSFGIVLYELLVGQVPFSSDTPYSIVHDHIFTPLPLPRSVNPDLPESLQDVLLKALAKDPAERYQRVSDLVVALEEAAVSLLAAQSQAWAQPLAVPSVIAERPAEGPPTVAQPASAPGTAGVQTLSRELPPSAASLAANSTAGLRKEEEAIDGDARATIAAAPMTLSVKFSTASESGAESGVAAAGKPAPAPARRKRAWLVAGGVLLLLCLCAAAGFLALRVTRGWRQDPQRAVERGDNLAGRGQYEAAMEAYRSAWETDPQCVDAYTHAAQASLQAGQPEAALEALDLGTRHNPDNLDLRVYAARLAMLNRAPLRAQPHVQWLIAHAPDNPLTLVLQAMADIVRIGGCLPEAEHAIQRALEIDSSIPEVHYAWAICLQRMGEHEAARAELQAVVDNPETNPWLHQRTRETIESLEVP